MVSPVWANETPYQTIIRFAEKHVFVIGNDGKKTNLKLLPYQTDFVVAGFPAQGIKNKLILCGPKKIGKSYLTFVIAMPLFLHPRFAKPYNSIYLVANSKDQCDVLWDDFVKQIEGHPHFSTMCKINKSSKTILITDRTHIGFGSTIKVLAADSKTAQGIRVDVAIYDEIGEAKAQDRKLYDVLQLGTANNPNAKFIAISTIAGEPNHFFNDEVEAAKDDPMAVCHVYQAKMGCDFFDKSEWYKANPALGLTITEEWFENKIRSMIRTPLGQRQCRRYLFNQPISLIGSIVSPDQLELVCPATPPATETDSEQFNEGEKLWLALDMGALADLAALTAISEGGLGKGWGYKADALIDTHESVDQIPYRGWEQAGWLVGTTGNTVNPKTIVAKIVELYQKHDVQGLIFDPAKMDEVKRLLADEIGTYVEGEPPIGLRLVPHGQGFISMGEAVNALEVAILDQNIRLDGNPLMRNHILMADITTDPAGNRKFIKGGRHSNTNRIDLAVSLAMAANYWSKEREIPSNAGANPFNDDEYEFIW